MSYNNKILVKLPFIVSVQSNGVTTTLIEAAPRIVRQIFCGTNYFLTAHHNSTRILFYRLE